jgi:hypothetical protein
VSVSALAGTIAAPFAVRHAGLDATRWLRAGFSLALALGILVIALPMAFDAGARGAGVDPVRVFSSGPAVAVEVGGTADLSVSGLVPGQSREATIRVANAGSEPSAMTLSTDLADRAGVGGVPLSSVLVLRIASPSGTVLYSGPLAALHRLHLGRIGAGATRSLRFTVTLPGSAGNEVEGSTLSAGLSWTAA